MLGWEGANSTEFDEATPHPVVIFMPEINKSGEKREDLTTWDSLYPRYPCPDFFSYPQGRTVACFAPYAFHDPRLGLRALAITRSRISLLGGPRFVELWKYHFEEKPKFVFAH